MTRVLVCGGREYGLVPKGCPAESYRHYAAIAHKERFMLDETLDVMHADKLISVVMHGAAPGADSHAGEWARSRLVQEVRFPADWKAHGKAAGPLRNARMLAEGKPDLVIAFPGGRGTADMVAKAKSAGVRVIEIGGRTP